LLRVAGVAGLLRVAGVAGLLRVAGVAGLLRVAGVVSITAPGTSDNLGGLSSTVMKLIIALPSPYARKARVALIEKGIEIDIVVENPWLPATAVPAANPLGKVPVLVLDDGRALHDSKVIIEYLDTLGAPPDLIPRTPELRVLHKQIEAVADGVSDAVVLITLERARPAPMRSNDWVERQRNKILAGTAELSRLLSDEEWFSRAGLGIGEIATGCTLGYLDLRFPEFDWRVAGPNLARLYTRLSNRPSFAQTAPAAQMLPSMH
jgi:glutathione S-transferase